MYSLSVPTGGGKTLSSLSFALTHAITNRLDRVIVVAPFISIIDQTSDVFRRVLGPDAVLEHHSGVVGRGSTGVAEDDRMSARSLLIENWDASIVVTTAVQFLESLFSNRPTDLRKLHNIANSVVVFDEAQTMPVPLMEATLSMIAGLSSTWRTSFLFTTATLPAFEDQPEVRPAHRRLLSGTIKEIMPTHSPRLPARVSYVWPAEKESLSFANVAKIAGVERQSLVILNTRKQAREVAREMLSAGTEVIHLSTSMCAAHRRDRLTEIRTALSEGQTCRVVSTQIVEAGVDLDFPTVFRAVGPLDSIVQAGGRCNREGKGIEPGVVRVIRLEDDGMPGGVYKMAVQITDRWIREGRVDVDDPSLFRRYFDEVYDGTDLDPKQIQDSRSKSLFEKVSEDYRVIDEYRDAVIVPYGIRGVALISALNLHDADLRALRRQIQAFVVNIDPRETMRGLRSTGAIKRIERLDLLVAEEWAYDSVTGLSLGTNAPVGPLIS
jgi:CRISPR-associated endonuclease/helicase Cas3